MICDACNVRPEWLGEHRCHGAPCTCQDPLCRMYRDEVTIEELVADDPQMQEILGTAQ